MNEVVVREAEQGDLLLLDALFREELEFHKKLMPDIFTIPETVVNEAWLESILEDEDRSLVVAEHEGRILAAILYRVMASSDDPIFRERRFGYVEELVVSDGLRRKGIGQGLLTHAVRDLEARGITEIEVNVWETNVMARSFYEKHGFRTLQRRMIMKV